MDSIQISYYKSLIDKIPVNIRNEKAIRQKFPEFALYVDSILSSSPKLSDNSSMSFMQVYWHIIHNDFEFKLGLCECGKRTSFRGGKYKTFCGCSCSNKSKATIQKRIYSNINRFGTKWGAQSPLVLDKMRKTCKRKYNVEYAAQSIQAKNQYKNTCLEKYGVENVMQNKYIQHKSVESCRAKYGYDYACQDKSVIERINNTKRINNTFNTSSNEEYVLNYFIAQGIDFIRQYKTKEYPFRCDFYLVDYQLYIEINSNWTHGGMPYNPEDNACKQKYKLWSDKSKSSKYYKNALCVWTVRDVLKRNTAKSNNLNYLEIFGTDNNSIIQNINDYIGK